MAPLMYEGISKMYIQSRKLEQKYIEAQQKHPEVVNPGVLKIFQKLLMDIPNLNNNKIKEEEIRIRDNSKVADIFDDLIRATMKSYIVLLTYNISEKQCRIVDSRYHENIDIREFIHKCYIESARKFHECPHIFYHEFNNNQLLKNKRDAHTIIKESIHTAIMRSLPLKAILEEYLSNDYVKDEQIGGDNSNEKYVGIKKLIERDIYGVDDRKILVDDEYSDSESESDSDNSDKNETSHDKSNVSSLEKLIIGGGDRKILESSTTNKKDKSSSSSSSDKNEDRDRDRDNDFDDGSGKDNDHRGGERKDSSHKDKSHEESKSSPPKIVSPPKSKAVNIEFGRNTASNKMFRDAIEALNAKKTQNNNENVEEVDVKVKQDTPAPKIEENKDHTKDDVRVDISRKGRNNIHRKDIKELGQTPQSEMMNKFLE
jgi:hypothetical protein